MKQKQERDERVYGSMVANLNPYAGKQEQADYIKRLTEARRAMQSGGKRRYENA